MKLRFPIGIMELAEYIYNILLCNFEAHQYNTYFFPSLSLGE